MGRESAGDRREERALSEAQGLMIGD